MAAGVAALLPAGAHDIITTKVTWSREISRLVYRRCVSCHREGGSAFSLMSYAESRPWAKAIKEETLERRMPPWGAVKGFGDFRNDEGLTQEELELISDWVEGGAPEGDPSRMPAAPELAAPAPADPICREIVVDGSYTLTHATTLAGIRARDVKQGESLQVTAQRPDGSIEPLIWLYAYQPRFAHAYWFRRALSFPAGTKIESTPVSAGTVALLIAPDGKLTSARTPGR